MNERMTDRELGDEIIRILKDECKKRAIKHSPVYTLAEILPLKTMDTLKTLAKVHGVKGYSKMSKTELAAAVAESLPDEKRMRDVLSIIDDGEWELLTKAACAQQLVDETSFIPVSDFLQSMGLLDVFYHDNHLIFVVSDEIKTKVKALQGTSFPKERARLHLLNDYALATTSLYGLIGQEDFVELFNSQNKEKTNADEVFGALMRFVSLNAGYCFWEEYLVNDAFEENDFKDVERYAKVMESKPRYTPPKDALLRYSDPDYYEATPHVKALRGFILSNLSDDPDETDDIIDEIHDLAAQEAKMQSIIDVFNKRDISFAGMEQMQKMMPLIMDVMNNTRLWLNHGHTPNELASIEKPHLRELKSQPVRIQKIGRNDPCPCGSGKKYKRCCGQG